jgi:hypothetical protein
VAIIIALIGADATIIVAVLKGPDKNSTNSTQIPPQVTQEPRVLTAQKIDLTDENVETSTFKILTITSDDPHNYVFTFDGFWQHPSLGCQNSVGDIVEPGTLSGTIKILIIARSLSTEDTVFSQYYYGNPITISEKGVEVICSPKDINSAQRHKDGHIPSAHISPCTARKNMSVTYYATN